MKRLGKVFLGVLCMMLLFAFSHASEIHWVRVTSNKKVTFKWDATTTYADGKLILMYVVYVYKQNKDEDPPKINVDRYKYKDKIEENSCEIGFKDEGRYLLGVKAALYKVEGGKISGVPESESEISWSSRKTCTNNNPFGVKVEK